MKCHLVPAVVPLVALSFRCCHRCWRSWASMIVCPMLWIGAHSPWWLKVRGVVAVLHADMVLAFDINAGLGFSLMLLPPMRHGHSSRNNLFIDELHRMCRLTVMVYTCSASCAPEDSTVPEGGIRAYAEEHVFVQPPFCQAS